MTAETVGRWSRAFVVTGVLFFAGWQLAHLAGIARPVAVVLGLYGFVFHVAFGKAYTLIPADFARELAFPRIPSAHLFLSVLGTGALALEAQGWLGDTGGLLGAVAWLLGTLLFVGAILWTVRDNITGAETGTAEHNHSRQRVDRIANAVVPIVFVYLLGGASLGVMLRLGIDPVIVPPVTPVVSHVLAAGTATLLVFAVGVRLLPRFLVAMPSTPLVVLVLLSGAIGPALLVSDFLGGLRFQLGAISMAIAIIGFAIAYGHLYWRSDRRRVGFYGVLLAGPAGIALVLLGLHMAFVGPTLELIQVHYRVALVGFLGLTIVGVTYQFYPPAIGSTVGIADRTALAAIVAIAGGLVLESSGTLVAVEPLARVGSGLITAGALAHAYVVIGLLIERRQSRS
ncbi:MAG: hypothetical protein U5K37_01660 [Natrialbaceae archaeon]|nr:hypothetical protein [Natrialbaceae archaeon]